MENESGNAPPARDERRPVLAARAPLPPHLARALALLAERVDVKEHVAFLARERAEVERADGAPPPERLGQAGRVRPPVVVAAGAREVGHERERRVLLERRLERAGVGERGEVRVRHLRRVRAQNAESGVSARVGLSRTGGASALPPARRRPRRKPAARAQSAKGQQGRTAFWASTKSFVSCAKASSRCLGDGSRGRVSYEGRRPSREQGGRAPHRYGSWSQLDAEGGAAARGQLGRSRVRLQARRRRSGPRSRRRGA